MASQQGVIGTWLVAEGIIVYRVISRQHRPPIPGELLATSGLFLLLGLLAIGAPSLAVTMGVGIDIAAFMNLAGTGTIGQALSGPPPQQQQQQFTPVDPTQVVPPVSQQPFGGWWPVSTGGGGISSQPFGGWWPVSLPAGLGGPAGGGLGGSVAGLGGPVG